MNLTLRVRTDRRSVIVKQSRPWVEKYDHIAAPWDRMRVEQRFYERVASIPEVAKRMPRLLGADAEARVVILEDLEDARDCTSLYAGDSVTVNELRELAVYPGALHAATRGEPDAMFANREMRQLNHAHIYEIPLARENGLELERYEPGLNLAAVACKRDAAYVQSVSATGERYPADGPCLLHGDFFPGSWLRTRAGVRIIDPEFCFYGDPAFDLGCAVAHLVLARQDPSTIEVFLEAYASAVAEGAALGARGAAGGRARGGAVVDPTWVARFAAAEIMRRLIGVAQLPIPPSDGWRAELLGRSRRAMKSASVAALVAEA